MPTHRRREPAAAGGQFSFASPAHENRGDAEADAYDTWAEKIKGKYNYFGRLEDVEYAGAGAWSSRRTTTRCGYDGEASGTPSPPELWQVARRYDPGAPPPAIARCRQEMLDLVKDAHENAYELSLIDMVETKTKTKKVVAAEKEEEKTKKEKKKGKKGTRSRWTSRSESMETGGHLLRMFVPRVPAALGGRKQQNSCSNSGTCAKVSPTSTRTKGELWSKEYGETASSSTTTSNSNGSSSSSSIKSRIIGSCYPFVSHNGKPAVIEE